MGRYEDAVSSLRSINQSTYDKLMLKYINDYDFWHRVYKTTRANPSMVSEPAMLLMSEALNIFGVYRPRLFERKAVALLDQHGGLEGMTPLQAVYLHLSLKRSGIWAYVKPSTNILPLPDLIQAVAAKRLTAQRARRYIVEMLTDSLERKQTVHFQQNTIDLMCMGESAPKDWVYAGMNWQPANHNSVQSFMGLFYHLSPLAHEVE